MPAILISYRKEDTPGAAAHLHKSLSEAFGPGSVYMDVARSQPGRDVRQVIDEHLDSAVAVLVIIGKEWLHTTDETGQRRVDNVLDVVHIETAAALKRDVPVIPVLVQGADMVLPAELPPDLADLAFRNPITLLQSHWGSDVEMLVTLLQSLLHDQLPIAAGGRAGASFSAPGVAAAAGAALPLGPASAGTAGVFSGLGPTGAGAGAMPGAKRAEAARAGSSGGAFATTSTLRTMAVAAGTAAMVVALAWAFYAYLGERDSAPEAAVAEARPPPPAAPAPADPTPVSAAPPLAAAGDNPAPSAVPAVAPGAAPSPKGPAAVDKPAEPAAATTSAPANASAPTVASTPAAAVATSPAMASENSPAAVAAPALSTGTAPGGATPPAPAPAAATAAIAGADPAALEPATPAALAKMMKRADAPAVSAAAKSLTLAKWTLRSGGCGAGPLTVSGEARFSIEKTSDGVVVTETFRGSGDGFEVVVTGQVEYRAERPSYDIPTTGRWSGSRVFKSTGMDRVSTSDGSTPRTANVVKFQSVCG